MGHDDDPVVSYVVPLDFDMNWDRIIKGSCSVRERIASERKYKARNEDPKYGKDDFECGTKRPERIFWK